MRWTGPLLAIVLAAGGPGPGPGPQSREIDVARRWSSAFASNDGAALEKLTALPFRFGTTSRPKKCEGPVKTAKALAAWLKCARKEQEVLVMELPSGIREGGALDSPGMTALIKRVPESGTWVRAFVNGDGVSFSLRFLVMASADGSRRVAALLLEAFFETG